jgi:hypothetical protein
MTASKLRYVLVVLVVASLIISTVVGYYGIDFLNQEVSKTNAVKADAETNLNAELYAQKAKKQFNNPEISKLSEYLSEVVPDNSYKNQFIADVYDYAAEAGVGVESLVYASLDSNSIPIKGTELVPVQLQLGSDMPYDNFISFVKKLENNLQQIQVVNIVLQPNAEDRSILQSASLTVNLYVEPKN